MPINDEVRTAALKYVDAHLFDEATIREGFSFVDSEPLLDLIVLELKSARYVYRLMEMLDLKDVFSHPFCKFQIVQYAGVFEAAIDHLIFEKTYKAPKLQQKVEAARAELEKHESLKIVPALSADTKITVDGSPAFISTLKVRKKARPNIKFEDIIKECNKLSFVDEKLMTEINEFYKKRNSVHLTARIRQAITVEVKDTKQGFRRVNAFCENVKRGFKKHGEPTSREHAAVAGDMNRDAAKGGGVNSKD